MLHQTGSRAVEAEGLTTQQWAVQGALSREKAEGGMSISGLIGRVERDCLCRKLGGREAVDAAQVPASPFV